MLAGSFTGERPAHAQSMDEFNPQNTPDQWLSHSANETPGETLARYGQASLTIAEKAGEAFRAGEARETTGPYGVAHWSVVTLHVLWDAWVHERDILLAEGAPPADGVSGSAAEQRVTTMYGALMTAVPGVRFNMPLSATITLDHGEVAPLHLEIHGEPNALAVIEVAELESPDLSAELLAFADSLAGRGAPLADVMTGPADVVGGMSILGQAI